LGCKIKLRDAFKGYTFDQDKIITPEETVGRFKNRLKEVNLDILEETVRIDNGRLNIPIYFSVRPVRSWSWRSDSVFSASGRILKIFVWTPTKT